MKKALIALAVLAAAGASAYAYYSYSKTAPAPTTATAPVTRGDIADTVGATGTLQAVHTVQVGTQVSGMIQELNADFNSLVRKGQVLARLDPSLFETQVEQARANLIRAEADVERLRVTLEDARTKLTRARELSARQLIPQTDLDTAEVNVRSIEAQIRSSQAQVTQAQASLNQTEVNLAHTIIEAPIDGLVISRNVDVGQTVAASMQAPTLFVLAADLTKMQVLANLDESDVGRIRPGQLVSFRVDAYPADDFTGTVSQVRLQPQTVQNVVTYATVIDVPNAQLKLKPGMTATVNIEIARRTNVTRVPNAALRFRPTNDTFAALGQAPPEPGGGGFGPDGPRRGGTAAAEGGPPQQPAAMPSARREGESRPTGDPGAATSGDGRGTVPSLERRAPAGESERVEGGGFPGGGFRGGRGGGMAERLQNLPPEARERALERMRARGFDPDAANGSRSDLAASTPDRPAAPPPARNPQATTIDALFGPLPTVETTGRVWLYVNNQLKPVRVRLGITDGQATELLEGDLQPGTEVVTNVTTGTETTRPTPAGPGGAFLFTSPGRFPPGGGPGGRGR